MVEPKFEIGEKLQSYELEWIEGFLGGGSWKVKGVDGRGTGFSVTYRKGEQHMSHTGAKCLNWKDVKNG